MQNKESIVKIESGLLGFSLRFIAGAFGALILLVATPLIIFGGAMTAYQRETSFWVDSLQVLTIIILFSAGYILIATYGDRVIQSLKLRAVAAILLAIPTSITAIPLVHFNHPETWPVMVPIFLFSLFLFSAFAWPAWLKYFEKPQPAAES